MSDTSTTAKARGQRAVAALRGLGFYSAGLDADGTVVQLSIDDATLIAARLNAANVPAGETVRCLRCKNLYPRHRLPTGICATCMKLAKEEGT